MFRPRRWLPEAWIPIIGGLLWLWCAASFGVVGFLFSVVPGCLLLSSGVSTLLYPGDLRIPQFTALGGLLGVPFALPAFFVAGPWTGLLLVLSSGASFIAAGAISVHQEPHADEVPRPVPSIALAAQVAIDDTILAHVALTHPAVAVDEQERVHREIRDARELFHHRGWFASPAAYHQIPPPLTDPVIRPGRSLRLDFEHVEFESGYEPDGEEPGRDRWLSRPANRTAHVWVLRHGSGPRPWLICIPGYRMGFPLVDLPAFHAARLHYRYGMNVAIPVLPFHGPRKTGRRSGDGFITGDFLDTVHAEAQAMWDLRRLLSWIHMQQGHPIGAYGLSLGGYNTALLASLEGLACAILGIPATDFTRLTWRHGAQLQIRYAEHHGLSLEEVSEVLSVVSPFAFAPRVPRERRYIFAAVADRMVPPEQVRDLWHHWEEPRIVWYQGAHVTFRSHPAVGRLLVDALRESKLLRS